MMVDDRFFREVQDNCWDPEVRLRECAVHGVHRQVLSTVPVLFYYWAKAQDNLQIARFLNDHMADVVARYPDSTGWVPFRCKIRNWPLRNWNDLRRWVWWGWKSVPTSTIGT